MLTQINPIQTVPKPSKLETLANVIGMAKGVADIGGNISGIVKGAVPNMNANNFGGAQSAMQRISLVPGWKNYLNAGVNF